MLTEFFQGREQGFLSDDDVPCSPGHCWSATPDPDSAAPSTDRDMRFESASPGSGYVSTVLSALISACSADSCRLISTLCASMPRNDPGSERVAFAWDMSADIMFSDPWSSGW